MPKNLLPKTSAWKGVLMKHLDFFIIKILIW